MQKVRSRVLCGKYIIYGANLVLLLFGFAILILSIWIRVDPRFSQLLSEQYFEVTNGQNLNVKSIYVGAYVLIAVGFLLTGTAFCGCCGAIRDSRSCLLVYCIFLSICMLAQLGIGIYIFIERDHMDDELGVALDNMVQKYYVGPDVLTQAIDTLQSGFECCGNSGCGDYDHLRMPRPRSCDLRCDGCRKIMFRILRDAFTVLATVGLVCLVAELLAMAAAFWFMCSDTARRSGAKPTLQPMRSVTQETQLSPNLSYTQLLNAQQQQIVVEQKPNGQPQHYIVQSGIPTQSLYYIQGPNNTLIPLQQQQQQYVVYQSQEPNGQIISDPNLNQAQQQHLKYS